MQKFKYSDLDERSFYRRFNRFCYYWSAVKGEFRVRNRNLLKSDIKAYENLIKDLREKHKEFYNKKISFINKLSLNELFKLKYYVEELYEEI